MPESRTPLPDSPSGTTMDDKPSMPVSNSVAGRDEVAGTEAPSSVEPSREDWQSLLSASRPWATKLIETALPIAIITGTAYYLGWVYYAAYFTYLAPNHVFPVLTTPEYVIKAFQLAFSSTAIVLSVPISILLAIFFEKPTSRQEAFFANIPYIVIIMDLLIVQFIMSRDIEGMGSNLFWKISSYILFMSLFVSLIYYKLSPWTFWREAPGSSRIFMGAFLITGMLSTGTSLVETKALSDVRELIDGEDSPSFYTIFDLKSERAGIDGHLFRVVLHRAGSYYVVPAMAEVANGEMLIVIPEEYVVSAITIREPAKDG